ncbi:hypothetical protein E1B28_004305 [Marasmius oreades]|uniref:Zn(2)-C6 fungal-type domain-containing protein n=1 Tax=Marasmius oreades TaxID=181124 RepID=A0A9P8ACV1_9AGAR|nr:uncharacterized protein E1B28_004305 [Marasmius oreades]KAG7096899.1 hypothetical protein E1B28_004305 [Marasmius oreades]
MVKPTTPIAEPNSPTMSSKRKKSEEEEQGSLSKKQRTRVSFSCGECHRRKQKCDRQTPCSHCVARKVPELCKAYTPGKSDHDLSARISRLEHIIEAALPQFCDISFRSTARRRSLSHVDDDMRSQNDDDPPATGGLFQSGKWYGNSASGSIAPGSVIEQLQNAVMPQTAEFIRTGEKPKGIEPLEPSAADNLKTLVQECGVSPHKIPEILQELPPLRTSDVLINYYFRQINWTRYAISEKDFRAAYASVCAHGAHGVGATNPNDVRFLPLLFVVLAIAVRLAPEEIAGDARSRRVTSLRYYWSSRRSLLIAAAIQPDSLDIVLTRLLSARFLTFDRRITECWSQLGAAVRTAEALGLHRDGASMGMDSKVVEYRRRIWSYLYHADRSYALVLGRPTSIQDDYVSTLPPLNLDDESSEANTHSPSPLSSPTRMSFCILRHQLAVIIGRIVHHFQKVRPSHYSEVVMLDDELIKFMGNLPPHYSLEPDTSLDEKHPFIPVHRYLLITETLFVRTSLHRPYILRRLSSDRYARSRNACFESAMTDFQVRQAFREKTNDETRLALSNAYREFQTAMISGIYLVIHPHGKDAETMHTILDTFMKDHEGFREMDETTLRELKTIEFLKNKALERRQPVEQTGTDGEGLNTSGTENAELLLSFQQQTSEPQSMKQPNVLSSDIHRNVSNGNITHSPLFQRLQQPVGDHLSSTSGSPAAEDDSTAQMIFNIVSNPMEGINGSVQWGNMAGTSSSGDFGGWTNSETCMPMHGPDPRLAVDGTDWNYYWEALVNQIPRGPGS